MNETEIGNESNLKSKMKKAGIFAAAFIIVFLAGFIPMLMVANKEAANHLITTKNLTRSEISNSIATAIVDARRGEYESARQKTSDFYTRLDAQIQSGDASAYSSVQNTNLKSVFTDRDAIITMLAQRDPASVGRLTDVYLNYIQAAGEPLTQSSNQTNTNSSSNAQ